jgi:flagellar biosynthetic protein FliP
MRPFIVAAALLAPLSPAAAQTGDLNALLPAGGVSASGRIVEIVALLTVLSVAPGLLIMVTSITRFIIALSFVRSGLGVQGAPANLVLISLALFMTFFVMAPTFDRAWQNGLKPMLDNQISQQDALVAVAQAFREFMLSQVRQKDIALFEGLSKGRFDAGDRAKVDLRLLIPAYMVSELRRGFGIGFLVVLPFLLIDIIVATLTMSMGMMMLPPSVISLPVKILFLRAGRWLESARRQSGPVVRSSLAQGGGPQMGPARRGVPMTLLNTSFSGMLANSDWLSSISQNVANANTTGYKNQETDFSTIVDSVSNTAPGVRPTLRCSRRAPTFSTSSIT